MVLRSFRGGDLEVSCSSRPLLSPLVPNNWLSGPSASQLRYCSLRLREGALGGPGGRRSKDLGCLLDVDPDVPSPVLSPGIPNSWEGDSWNWGSPGLLIHWLLALREGALSVSRDLEGLPFRLGFGATSPVLKPAIPSS